MRAISDGRTVLPLLGEREGVRAVFFSLYFQIGKRSVHPHPLYEIPLVTRARSAASGRAIVGSIEGLTAARAMSVKPRTERTSGDQRVLATPPETTGRPFLAAQHGGGGGTPVSRPRKK